MMTCEVSNDTWKVTIIVLTCIINQIKIECIRIIMRVQKLIRSE